MKYSDLIKKTLGISPSTGKSRIEIDNFVFIESNGEFLWENGEIISHMECPGNDLSVTEINKIILNSNIPGRPKDPRDNDPERAYSWTISIITKDSLLCNVPDDITTEYLMELIWFCRKCFNYPGVINDLYPGQREMLLNTLHKLSDIRYERIEKNS